MSDDGVLTTLPVLPVKRAVLFPGIMMPLTIGRNRSVAAVDAGLKTEEKTILVVAQRDPEKEEAGLEDLYTIGRRDRPGRRAPAARVRGAASAAA